MGNNPIRYVDPNGRSVSGKIVGFCCFALAGLSLIAGVVVAATGQVYVTAGAVTTAKMFSSLGTAIIAVDTIADAKSMPAPSSSLPVISRGASSVGAPAPNNGDGKKHGNDDHDANINKKIKEIKEENGQDIRKNQQQVDAKNNKVGNNRPDVQWNDTNGNHHCYETDRSVSNSIKHGKTIRANDPNAIIELNILP